MTENTTNGISRRGFLGLGALVAAGATAALSGCAPKGSGEAMATTGAEAPAAADWLGAAPEIADIARTEDTDFLIVGAGTAGMTAALTAQEAGLDFIICEKNGTVQETREYVGAVDSAYQKQMGVEVDKPKLLNELTRYASGKCNQEVIRVWLDESGECLDWMDSKMQAAEKQCVVDLVNEHPTGGTDYYLPTLQHVWLTPYTPPMRNDVFASLIEEAGNPVRFGWELVRLVEADGVVTGAIFNTEEGYVQVNAKDTLIATGGYPANPVMMSALSPAALACCTASSFAPNDTGDGIKAAIWAGAVKELEASPMIFDRGAVAPGVDCGYTSEGEGAMLPGGIFQENIGSQPFMKVNRHGKRFVNESMPYDFMCNAAAQQPGGVWCQVFDANAPEDILRFDTIGCSAFAKQMMAVGMPIDEFCAVALDAGCMVKADTVEELADAMGFTGADKEAFLEQVERYNAQFDAQIDDDFGKEAFRLSALRTAPFYGCWFGGSLLTTLDGIRINKHCQALNEAGEVVEGLYVAGDASGSFFSGNYPEYIVGVASGRSSTQGRHVARYLAGEIA
ncbi:FAD-dependent oxidoreductase [Adlercreutzia shanghongiae]|uniref:FAD-binding protein n=1 Tax=Adlercreutzia shanghongiae TaxID=3111773 RepID=A0ABU6IXZ3_9ACTN|nr:FAD-binding protein [Adlercreutzia sp. R22]MEC4294726.1 FAD-binding protein [Adlercreutzia sp. R22]